MKVGQDRDDNDEFNIIICKQFFISVTCKLEIGKKFARRRREMKRRDKGRGRGRGAGEQWVVSVVMGLIVEAGD